MQMYVIFELLKCGPLENYYSRLKTIKMFLTKFHKKFIRVDAVSHLSLGNINVSCALTFVIVSIRGKKMTP